MAQTVKQANRPTQRLSWIRARRSAARPGGGLPMAVGHECDVRVSLLREVTAEVPDGAVLPEEPGGMLTLANGVLPAYAGLDHFTRKVPLKDAVVAQMLYWERPQGGRVFHAGSLGSGWGLSVDPKFQILIRNVLDHFGVPGKK